MAIYIVLNNYTDQGIRKIKDTTKRADDIREMGKKFGVTVKAFYWTLGNYDVVDILEAPDDATIAAFLAGIGSAGNVHTLTLRAFSEAEMDGILEKLG